MLYTCYIFTTSTRNRICLCAIAPDSTGLVATANDDFDFSNRTFVKGIRPWCKFIHSFQDTILAQFEIECSQLELRDHFISSYPEFFV